MKSLVTWKVVCDVTDRKKGWRVHTRYISNGEPLRRIVTIHTIISVHCAAGYASYLVTICEPWSSLVEGGEGSYLPNCETTLVIALDVLSLLFCIFVNTTSYHLGRYKPSPPSTKELHVRVV